MSERASWWTNCQECNLGFTIEQVPHSRTLTDPSEAEEGPMYCPFDGSMLTGWNQS